MGLRFICVARWGWVAKNRWPILSPAHSREKSAVNFRDTSIHRLLYWEGIPKGRSTWCESLVNKPGEKYCI
jgi:hypothetical protein